MLRKAILFIVVYVMMSACAFNAQALGTGAGVIDMSDCYFSDDVFYDGTTQYVIRNTAEVFYNACAQECLQYTKTQSCSICLPAPPDCSASASSLGLSDYQMNLDIILDCQTKCRGGGQYVHDFRLNTQSPLKVTGSDYLMCNMPTLSTNISYTQNQPQFMATQTDFTVTAGESIIIILNQPPSGYANMISQCGHTAKIIEPLPIRSLSDYDWLHYPGVGTGSGYWHAKNPIPYDTGMDIMDGDYLTITYTGEYRSRIDGSDTYDYKTDNSLYIRKALTSNTTSWQPQTNNDFYIVDASKIVPPGDVPDAMPTNGSTDMGVFGLQGSSVGALQNRYYNSDNQTGVAFDNGYVPVTEYQRTITLQGIVKNFSANTFSRLGIMHPDSFSGYDPSWWSDNIGGFSVTIERQGCVIQNGQNLQYGVGAYNATCSGQDSTCVIGTYSLPTDDNWQDVPDISSYAPVTVTAPSNPPTGMLFFRIKPLDANMQTNSTPACNYVFTDSTLQSICSNTQSNITSYFSSGASDGQYFITIKRAVENDITAFISDIISFPILLLHYYLFGDEGSQDASSGYCSQAALNFVQPYELACGIVPQLFNQFVSGAGYIQAIRAALVLYLAISALTFLGGFAPMTEREFINRLLKIGVIVTLISPNSWEFFNTNVFQIFVDGALQIMVYIVNISQTGGVMNMTESQAVTNFGNIFSFFDLTFSLIMSKVIWFKIFAILFSSFYGIFMVFAIINGFFRVLQSILKASVLYAMNLIGIGLLLLLAPLFISFMLFKTTWTMFDAWVKQLLSYAIQPIVVIICLFILNNLLIFALHKVFEFTICANCIFGIHVPLIELSVCFLPGFVALSSMFSTSIFVMPIKLLGAAFFLSIISSAMEQFVEFGSQLSGQIISQGNSIDYAAQGNRKSMIAEQTAALMPSISLKLGGKPGDSLVKRVLKAPGASLGSSVADTFIGKDNINDLKQGAGMGKALVDKLSSKKGDDSDGGNTGGEVMIKKDKAILKLFLLFIILNFYISDANSQTVVDASGCSFDYNQCIQASDLGVSLIYNINAMPKWQDDYYFTLPQDHQVVNWTEAGIYTTGALSTVDVRSKLKIYVDGMWGPWGTCPNTLAPCPLIDCGTGSPTGITDQCFENVGCNGGTETGKIIQPKAALPDIPCSLNQGRGIYGLISIILPDGTHQDPNDPNYMNTQIWPTAYFRTFEILATQSDVNGNYFLLDYTQVCQNAYSGANFSTNCVPDTLSGTNFAVKGWLYFRFNDTYYQDNTGQYQLTVSQGVFTQPGFIEKNFNNFNDIIVGFTKMMSYNLFVNTQFISMVRALLVLYIGWSAILFLIGSIQMTLNELLGRLLKFSIVSVLLTPDSFDFFNTYLLNVFVGNDPNNNYWGIPQEIASYIERFTLFYDPNDPTTPRFAMPENPTPLSVFDIILQMVTSLNLHIKIWAMLFYKWSLLFIIIIYMGLFFLVAIVLRGTMLWFVASLRIAILLAVAPLFIMFLLFNITKTYFDNWLRQMMGAALTLIIVAASMALLIGLLTTQLYNLMYYEVCNIVVWSMTIPLVNFNFEINWWYPDVSMVESAVSIKNLFSFLIFGALFNSFSKQIPQICDILGKMGIGSMSSMYDATGQGLNQIKSGVMKGVGAAVGAASAAAMAASGGSSKVAEGVARGAQMAAKGAMDAVNKASKK